MGLKMKAALLSLLSLLPFICFAANSAELFDCETAGEFDISRYYDIREEIQLQRALCMQAAFRGTDCSKYYSLSNRLVVEEFKIECTLANFLTKTKLALELNDPTITATLNDFEDSIGSSLVQLLVNLTLNSMKRFLLKQTLLLKLKRNSYWTMIHCTLPTKSLKNLQTQSKNTALPNRKEFMKIL